MTTFATECVVCGLPGLADFSAPVPAVLHGWRDCLLPPRDVPHPEAAGKVPNVALVSAEGRSRALRATQAPQTVAPRVRGGRDPYAGSQGAERRAS